jgi:4a-hydroxytetrahydrobiopterin dehydratase
MQRQILGESELAQALKTLNNWQVEGRMLKKQLKFENFALALDFVNRVGALAEAADHHPDITFGWGYAEIALTTHDRGGVTDVDVTLAAKIDQIAGQNPER